MVLGRPGERDCAAGREGLPAGEEAGSDAAGSENRAKRIQEVEQFLLSRWYAQLTDVNGEWLLKKLREEVVR